jgi:mono/diheme cytochrome c family protein
MAMLAIPAVAHISITIRLFVIGFIHLVMLGTVTLGIGAVIVRKGWLPADSLSKNGWTLLIWAFTLTEILLFGQGLLLWVESGYIPHYHLIVLVVSVLFPAALAILLVAALRNPLSTHEFSNQSKSNFNIQTKNQSMKSSVILSIGIAAFLWTSCGGGSNQGTYTPPSAEPAAEKAADPKGIGEIKSVEIGEGIDEALANKGKAIVDMKCTACHQLNDKRLVGPGFQGVTNRRKPEWIMNMITNVDVMLDQDPTAQALLEECLTRMPNQNISVGDARDILEFLRKNDLEKAGSKDGAL